MEILNRFKTFDDTKKVATTSNRFTDFGKETSFVPEALGGTNMSKLPTTGAPTYKSPTSLTYKPEPIVQKGLDTIQSIGAPIAKDVLSSPYVQGAQKAGTELAGEIRKPIQGVISAGQTVQKAPIKILNNPAVASAMQETLKRTSGTGIWSAIQAAGPDKTFQEAYEANRAYQAGDPSKLKQFLYQLGDTAPQTAIGVALNFVPIAGPTLSTAYWTALSAGSELDEKGEITNLGNIGIDVIGDRMLGSSIESLFKASSKTMWQVIKQTFATEGGTEVAQDLLKYGNDYRSAKTQAEKDAVLAKAKEYFTSGQILMTAGVGGLTGAGIGVAMKGGQNAANLYQAQTPGQKQAGFIKNPIASNQPNSISYADELKELVNEPPKQTKEVSPEEIVPLDQMQLSFETAQKELPPDMVDIFEPLQNIISKDKSTPLDQRINLLDYLRTPWRVFEKMGIRQSYQALMEGYDNYLKELPQNIDKITNWSQSVSAESNEKIFRFLDGENVILTQEEAKVASEIKTWLSEWADRMGMEPDTRISDYITHVFPFGKGGEIPEEISSVINKKIPGSVYNPFLLQRQGAEGYLKDTWKALDAYVKRATRKVHMDPALDQLKEDPAKLTETSQLDYINSYVSRINLRPSWLDSSIDNGIKQIFGYNLGVRPTAQISRGIRKMIARAKIGGSITSLGKNLTQGVNTYSELGTQYLIRGYMDLAKFGSKELEEQGVLLSHFIEDQTYSAIKKAAEKADKVLFANMNASELINRGAAYYGAKQKFIAGKTKAKEYREAFGKDMPNGYKPTLEDAKAYGKFVAAKTQFLFGAIDTPVALASDLARTSAQFQMFPLKQQEFILEMVHHKDWLKLTRYIAASALLFQYIGGAFGMSWKDTFPFFTFGKPPFIQFAMDVWGAVFGTKDQYGNVPSGKARLKTVGKSLFTNVMPMGAQIKRSYEGFTAVNQGHSDTSAGNWQYYIDKTPMNYVRGTLFGKANLPEAKAYYNKKSGKTTTGGSALRFKKY